MGIWHPVRHAFFHQNLLLKNTQNKLVRRKAYLSCTNKCVRVLDGLVLHRLTFLISLHPRLFHFFSMSQIYLHLRFGPDIMVSLLTKIVAANEIDLSVTPWYLDPTEDGGKSEKLKKMK